MEPLAPGLGDDEPGPPGLDEPVAAATEVSLMAPQTSDHHAQPTGYGTPAYSTAVSGHPYGSAGAYGAQPVHPEYQTYDQYYYPGYHTGAAGETGEKHSGSLQTAALFCWPTTISSRLLSFYLAACLPDAVSGLSLLLHMQQGVSSLANSFTGRLLNRLS